MQAAARTAGATRSPSWTSTKWTNITDEDIEKADDTIQDSNEGMGDLGDMFGSNTTKEKKVKVDDADLRRYNKALRGTKTVDGIEITRVSVHAVKRIIGRGIYPKRVKEVISSADTKISPCNTQKTVCYDYNNKRVVVDKTNGTIVSIMHRRQRNG